MEWEFGIFLQKMSLDPAAMKLDSSSIEKLSEQQYYHVWETQHTQMFTLDSCLDISYFGTRYLTLRVRISYFSRRALQAPTKIGELDCLGQSTSRGDTYGP